MVKCWMKMKLKLMIINVINRRYLKEKLKNIDYALIRKKDFKFRNVNL